MKARPSVATLAGIVVLGITVTACGGSTPTAPSSGSGSGSGSGGTGSGGTGGGGATSSCRLGPATYRIVTTGPAGFSSTNDGSCTFNAAAVEGTCTNNYTDSLGQRFTSVSTTRNTSVAQVVDEVSVIPPLTLSSTTTSSVLAGGTVPASTGTATRTFSGRRVLTQTSTSGGQSTLTTYTAWDASDRPTAATQTSGSTTTSIVYSYDNATRTQTITTSGVTCTQTFDVNGNPAVGTCGGTVATTTVLSTISVCR